MVDYTEPKSWPTPTWHKDFGDVQVELEHLRDLAILVIEQFPQLSVGLGVPEIGIMFLIIINDGRVLSEIYSFQSKNENSLRNYGVFLHPNSCEEEEIYTSCKMDVIKLLKSIR